MKTLTLFSLLCFSTIAHAQLTAIHTSPLGFSAICIGSLFQVSFTTTGTANNSNEFIAQISNKNGSFGNAQVIGSITGQVGGTIDCATSSLMTEGTGYRIRVVSTSPVVTGSNNGSNITFVAYCVAPTGVSAGGITSTSATISWNPAACNPYHYKVRYAIMGTSSYTTVNSASTSKFISGLNPLTTYQYSVRNSIMNFPGHCKWTPNQTFMTQPRLSNVEQEESTPVLVFPNPFTSAATITFNREGNFDFLLYDIFGREVFKSAIVNRQSTIERGNLPVGVYFYQVKDEDKVLACGNVVVQ